MTRPDGRRPDELRPLELIVDFTENPLASVLCVLGRTKVLCTVCAEENVPRFLQGTGRGWVSAEYSLLPGSTDHRVERESSKGRLSGRTQEIQRLIGRSLRSVTSLNAIGERTLWVDCDVLQADGGTRTAAITGGFTALAIALARLREAGFVTEPPLKEKLAAISVGVVQGNPVLDLCYAEDSRAEVDMNVVGTGNGQLSEIQGTGEENTFSRAELEAMLALADLGLSTITDTQDKVLDRAGAGFEPSRS